MKYTGAMVSEGGQTMPTADDSFSRTWCRLRGSILDSIVKCCD